MAEKHGIEDDDVAESIVKRSKSDVDGEGSVVAPGNATVGVWEVPDVKEQEPMAFDMDVNGDDDEVEAEVMRLKREKSIALKQEADVKKAELDKNSIAQVIDRQPSPPARRARRNVGPARTEASSEREDAAGPAEFTSTNLTPDVAALQKELESARETIQTAKEQATLLKQLYDDASRTALEAEQKAQRLSKENSSLQTALSQGLATASKFKEDRIIELERSLKQTRMQLDLLKRLNELTDSHIRRKAALWDEQEDQDERRRKIIEQRQAKREIERRALQQALLGDGAPSMRQSSPKPHELFLAVDMADEKIDVDEMAEREAEQLRIAAAGATHDNLINGVQMEDLDEDDELAALRREASQYDGAILTDLNGPRSRRPRNPVEAIQSVSPTPPILESGEEGQQLADAIYDSQQQAFLTATNDLEDQLSAMRARRDSLPFDQIDSPSLST